MQAIRGVQTTDDTLLPIMFFNVDKKSVVTILLLKLCMEFAFNGLINAALNIHIL